MKKLALTILFLISTTSVFALSETETNCDEMYASNDSVASVEAESPGNATQTSSSTESTALGQ